MKYKVGDKLKLKIVKNKLYLKKEKIDKYLEEEFLIIAIDNRLKYYTLLIHDHMVGWIINEFHILHYGVDQKFFGKRFYDVFESQL